MVIIDFDLELEGNEYEVGEWVWEYIKPERDMKVSMMCKRGPERAIPGDEARVPKLRPRWTGPYKITSVRVVDTTTRTRSRKLHVDNIKPYFSNEPEYNNYKTPILLFFESISGVSFPAFTYVRLLDSLLTSPAYLLNH